MSLAGNLEDLALGDIVQIISLSRKTGTLSLRRKEQHGFVRFRDGQVVHARSSEEQRFLGEVLVERGFTDASSLNRALLLQKQQGGRERLGRILINSFKVDAKAVENVAREQIKQVMQVLFTWEEGTFEFDLREDVETVDDLSVDPVQFMLEQGLNPHLLLSGDTFTETDEATPLPGLPAELQDAVVPAAMPAEPTPRRAGHTVVLVDDDTATLESLSACLSDRGWKVETFRNGEEALVTIDDLYRHHGIPTVIIDLIMPRMDGSGILGGLELLELLHGNYPDLPVVAMADYHNLEAERKVLAMGVPFILKPRRSEVGDTEAGSTFRARLLEEIGENGAPAKSCLEEERVDIGAELLREMGVEQPATKQPLEASGISLLRSMLAELNNPTLGGGIVLLVLRFAGEFMSRAVIFSVREDRITGLGQFGIMAKNADALVRDMCIPCHEPSLFSQALDSHLPAILKPGESQWDSYLFDRIGGKPAEVFVGPIISGGKVVAILYGDTLPEGKQFPHMDSLEIFLSQAGIAIEKALLERRLEEMNVEEK